MKRRRFWEGNEWNTKGSANNKEKWMKWRKTEPIEGMGKKNGKAMHEVENNWTKWKGNFEKETNEMQKKVRRIQKMVKWKFFLCSENSWVQIFKREQMKSPEKS